MTNSWSYFLGNINYVGDMGWGRRRDNCRRITFERDKNCSPSFIFQTKSDFVPLHSGSSVNISPPSIHITLSNLKGFPSITSQCRVTFTWSFSIIGDVGSKRIATVGLSVHRGKHVCRITLAKKSFGLRIYVCEAEPGKNFAVVFIVGNVFW